MSGFPKAPELFSEVSETLVPGREEAGAVIDATDSVTAVSYTHLTLPTILLV